MDGNSGKWSLAGMGEHPEIYCSLQTMLNQALITCACGSAFFRSVYVDTLVPGAMLILIFSLLAVWRVVNGLTSSSLLSSVGGGKPNTQPLHFVLQPVS